MILPLLLVNAASCKPGNEAPAAATAADPLPSWNDGAAKQSILEFVSRVTREGGPDFVPPAERIATFDNDGTLWSEKPLPFQILFAFDRIKAMAPEHPEWRDQTSHLRPCSRGTWLA